MRLRGIPHARGRSFAAWSPQLHSSNRSFRSLCTRSSAPEKPTELASWWRFVGLCPVACSERRRDLVVRPHPSTDEMTRLVQAGRCVENKEMVKNSRDLQLHGRTWIPLGTAGSDAKPSPSSAESDSNPSPSKAEVGTQPLPRAVILLVHGYGDHSGFMHQPTVQRLVGMGCAVCAYDQQGHGRSQGLHGLVTDWRDLVDDGLMMAERLKTQFPTLPLIVMGESMGGAVALQMARRDATRQEADGSKRDPLLDSLILVAPMCAIMPELRPPQLVVTLLRCLSFYFPSLPITPIPSVLSRCFSDEAITRLAASDELRYSGKPRLATAREMMAMAEATEASLQSSDLTLPPFLCLHGGADTVTDPRVSEQLWQSAQRIRGKNQFELKIHEGALHGLLHEPEQNVFADIAKFLDQRVCRHLS